MHEESSQVNESKTAPLKACTLCGGEIEPYLTRALSIYATAIPFGIARCTRCRAGVTQPSPTPASLAAHYSESYDYGAHRIIAPEKRWRARHLLSRVAERPVASALDVGCMHGYLLDELASAGVRRVTGVEYSDPVARAARARGLDVFSGELADFARARPGESFDLIVAQHVLEHVLDPSAFLRQVNGLLTERGRAVLCVPHMGSRSQRLFKRAWGWWQVPVHLYHFSPESLDVLLEQAGLQTVSASTRGGDSLFVLLSLFYSINAGAATSPAPAPPGALKRAAIAGASAALRPYLYVGDEELIVVAERGEPPRAR